MKSCNQILAIICISVVFACQSTLQKALDEESVLVNYLTANWETPEKYIIKKFDKHEYVIVGEYHRIKHDVDLIIRVIPELYEKGIYNLAMEFGALPEQPLVDSLLRLSHFDRKLARTIMFKSEADWAFKEYIDIYEAAWKVNQTSNSDEPKFRIIHLAPPFDPCKEGSDRFGGHDWDKCMADIVLNELVSKNAKALIYAGSHHSFTKFHLPYYDFEKDKLDGFVKNRMGNILYDTLKERTFNIFLHAPWISDQGYDQKPVSPVNGTIDSIMRSSNITNIGFDVYNSPFGDLRATNTLYAFGNPDFSLKLFCDGYIFQNHFEDYESMTMEDNFITSENMNDFITFMKCIGTTDEELTNLDNEKVNELLFYDIKKWVGHLK